MIAGDTPEELLIQVAQAQATDPSLGLQGVHFFTLASLSATVDFVDEHTRTGVPA
jgi:methylenetetrahydrofolate reductase (NADPH)